MKPNKAIYNSFLESNWPGCGVSISCEGKRVVRNLVNWDYWIRIYRYRQNHFNT